MPKSRVPEVVAAGALALQGDAALMAAVGDRIGTFLKKPASPHILVLGGDEAPWADAMTLDAEEEGGRTVDVIAQVASTQGGSTEVDQLAADVMEIWLADDGSSFSDLDGYGAVSFVRNSMPPPVDLMSDGVLWYVRLVQVRVTLT